MFFTATFDQCNASLPNKCFIYFTLTAHKPLNSRLSIIAHSTFALVEWNECPCSVQICHTLTEKLVAMTMGSGAKVKAPASLNDIITVAKRISPR